MTENNLDLKDPDSVVDYSIDWETALDDDTIATSTWLAPVPTGITINSNSNTTTMSTVWLSGGTAGTKYRLTNRITTVGGRTLDQTIGIRVASR